MAAYPGLSELQADLLLRTFRQIKILRSHAPSAVVAWYEDFVWTNERESQGAQRIETAESLSLLLRYAYQRNDLRSLLRIETRAARTTTALGKQYRTSSTTLTSMPKELADFGMDGISIWPDPDENPSILAYNLKVAFAAREGNWVQIDELLNDARLSKMSSAKAARSSASSARSVYVLNPIGWGSLLHCGLGNVRKLQFDESQSTSTASKGIEAYRADLNGSEPSNDSASSLSEDVEAEKIRKATEDRAQMQAKLAVTKHLLPALLRYTSGSNNATSTSSARQSDADVTGPKTPTWLLQSVLKQLADRGEAASVIRIVQLAISEESTAVTHGQVARGASTDILNLALTACVRNHNVNLAETLRIFNGLTGSQLGQSISGPAVLTRPTIMNVGQRESHSRPQPSATKDNSKNAKCDLPKSGDESAKQKWMAPNEESLVLVLKKVRHPLFRAAWTRRLVEEFERLFPMVKLAGRTFRMIIDKCVTPAAQSSSSEPDNASSPERAAASTLPARNVASGRRGRRLRQEATKPSSSDTAPTHVVAAPGRRPIVKQSILLATLDDILGRFHSSTSLRFHRSTTNRRRFEHTLLRAKRTLQAKKAFHQDQIHSPRANESDKSRLETHHLAAISQIDALLDRVAQVQRLGRCNESRGKKT
ncbi:hypothetical protein [Sporisorium scitamineum]|nr:hypothetical protein [Sporisorium scitamineum]